MSLKKSLKDIGIVGLSKIIVSVSSLLLLPIISKSLGSDGYGLWSQSRVTINLVTFLSGLGLTQSLVRYLPGEKNKKNEKEIFYSSFFSILTTNIIIVLIFFILKDWISSVIFGGYDDIFLLVIIAIPFYSIVALQRSFFQGKGEFKKFSIFRVAQKLLTLILVIFLIYIGWGIYGAILSIIIGGITLFVITYYLIWGRIGFKLPKFNRTRQLLKYGLPLVITGIFSWVVTSSDRYLITYFLDVSSVGIYSAAYGIGFIIYQLSVPIQKVLKPNISQQYDNGNLNQVKYQLKQILRLYLMFAIPSFLGLLAISKPLLLILSTKNIAMNGYLITPIVGLAAVFWGVGGILGIPVILKEKTKILAFIWGSAATINFGLNIIIIPYYGIIGAGFTTLMAYIVAFLILIYYSSQFVRISIPWEAITKFLLGGMAMFFVIMLYSPVGLVGLVTRIILGIGSYFLLIYLLKTFREEEKRFIKRTLGFD